MSVMRSIGSASFLAFTSPSSAPLLQQHRTIQQIRT